MTKTIRIGRFTVGTGLTPAEMDRLKELAQQEARSMSAQITVMVRQQLSQMEKLHESRIHDSSTT